MTSVTAIGGAALEGSTGEASSSVRRVDAVASLTELFAPRVNVMVLARPMPSGILAEAERFVSEPIRVLSAMDVRSASASVLRALPSFPALASDIRQWVEVVGDLTGSDRVGVRLARVTGAMCPRLHVDLVSLRVVVTYLGPGTEYVASEQVDRRWLGHAAAGVPDHSSGVLRDPAAIESAAAGEVVFLKGEAWPDNRGRGAVHRSPPASDVTPRVVLTLDPLD